MEDPLNTFTTPGIYQVELCVEGECGEYGCISKSVTVEPPGCNITAQFSGGDHVIREGQSISFYDESYPHDDIIAWSWYFDWENRGEEPDLFYEKSTYCQWVTRKFNTIGEYKVRLYTHENSEIGCNPYEKTITVVEDWGVDVPTQTENQIITSGMKDHYLLGPVDVASNTMVACLQEFPYWHESRKISLYVNKDGKWIRTATLSPKDNELIRSVVVDGNTVIGRGSRDLYVFEKPTDGWINMNETKKYQYPIIVVLVRLKYTTIV